MAGGKDALSSSLTDMVTSLMVIFILLLVVYLRNQEEQKAASLEVTDLIHQELKTSLEDSIEGVEIKKIDPLTLVVIVPDDKLKFNIGQSSIFSEDLQFLDDFGRRLLETVCSESIFEHLRSVVVEGHADPSGLEDLNLGLSQGRALEVMKYIRKVDLKHSDCFLDVASASGRGTRDCEYREDRELWAECRRVKFKIRVKSRQEKVLEQSMAKSEGGNDFL